MRGSTGPGMTTRARSVSLQSLPEAIEEVEEPQAVPEVIRTPIPNSYPAKCPHADCVRVLRGGHPAPDFTSLGNLLPHLQGDHTSAENAALLTGNVCARCPICRGLFRRTTKGLVWSHKCRNNEKRAHATPLADNPGAAGPVPELMPDGLVLTEATAGAAMNNAIQTIIDTPHTDLDALESGLHQLDRVGAAIRGIPLAKGKPRDTLDRDGEDIGGYRRNCLAACRLAMEGLYGKANQRMNGSKILPMSDELAGKIAAKVPSAAKSSREMLEVIIPHEAYTPELAASLIPNDKACCETLWNKIKSNLGSTGTGMDEVNYKMLHKYFNCKGDRDRTSVLPILRITAQFLAGKFDHDRLRPFVSTQRLVPLAKPDGGVRPIGILRMLSRLSGALSMSLDQGTLESLQDKLDWGTWVKGGTVAAPKTADAFLRRHPGSCAVFNDISNAYGEARKEDMFNVATALPFSRLAFRTIYIADSDMTIKWMDRRDGLREVTFINKNGVIQGCTMASPIFDIVNSRIVEPVRSSYKDAVWIVTIHDDSVTLALNPAEAAAATQALKQRYAEHGMQFNMDKARCFTYSTDPGVIASIDELLVQPLGVKFCANGVIYCGAPIGSDEYCMAFLRKLVDKIGLNLKEIEEMCKFSIMPDNAPAVQASLHLIRQCLPSQFQYAMQTIKPSLTHPFAKEVDDMIVESVLRILNFGVSYPVRGSERHLRTRAQILLPLREGGLGFYSCEAACEAAWVGAWNVAKALVNRVVDLKDAGTDLAVCAPEAWSASSGCEIRTWPQRHGPRTHPSQSIVLWPGELLRPAADPHGGDQQA